MRRLDPRRLLFDRDVLDLMGLGLLVKPVGLVTQILVARWFGAGAELDAYQLAFFLVTFGEGALSRVFKGALAPHLIQRLQTMTADAYARYQNAVVGLFLGGGAAWLLLLAVLVAQLVGVIWPDLPETTATATVRMLLVLVAPALLMVANNLVMAVLNLHRRFHVAGAMPLLNAVCMLGALLAWHDRLGIWALPAGFALSQALIWPLVHGRALAVRALRPMRPAMTRADLGVIRELVALMAIAELMLTVNVFLDRWFATGLEPGSISSLHFASHIITAIMMLFGASLITVIFPRMSAAIAAGDLDGCSRDIAANLKRTAHLVVPASLMIAVASPEIVRVLFQRGAFDAADAARTSGAMSMYSLGLGALVINGLIARVFHSLQLLKDKAWLAVQYLGANALLNAALVGPMQVRGLALASTLAIASHLLLSLWVLHRRDSGLRTGRFAAIIGEAFAVGAVAMGAWWLLPVVWPAVDGATGLVAALGVGAAKGGTVAGCYLAAWLVRGGVARLVPVRS